MTKKRCLSIALDTSRRRIAQQLPSNIEIVA